MAPKKDIDCFGIHDDDKMKRTENWNHGRTRK